MSAESSAIAQLLGGVWVMDEVGAVAGLMVVIEEAESALGDRRTQRMSDWRRAVLNAVLWYTGE